METPIHENNSTCWNLETNWTVCHGSLENSITFESPDFPIESNTREIANRKPLLVLKPSSSASGPCEINISFTQKHEIRQVYVRSTARVYEIYYAPALQSDNEYLCTVRCSIADVEEDLLLATNIEEDVCANSKGSNGTPAQEKVAVESNIGTNEDDWVEVKIPAALHHDRNGCLPKQTTSSTRICQEFYEATAEISDTDPCMSITLRLLSLQNKGCIYIDEVYVFAEPIESTDSENGAVQVENSAGSTLMTMLVPTLMQLSKSRVGQLEDQHASNSMGKRETREIESRTSGSTNTTNGIQQDVKPNVADWQNEKLQVIHQEMKSQEVPTEVSDGKRTCDSDVKNDLSYCQVERVLEQLMSRVSRIEDICLRFEENMLKPINSMETRLQRVEQQVEVLAKNSQCSGSPSCTRFSAPAFSSDESNSSSSCNDVNDSQPCDLEKDTTSNTTYKLPDDASTSVSAQFLPSLVVTAPEFSCCDDEENHVFGPLKNSPKGKPKKALSIDDALAAALAGFSSMTDKVAVPELAGEESCNDEPSKSSQSLKVTAPEFTGEENGNEVNITSPSCQNGKSILPLELNRVGGIVCASNSISTRTNSAIEGARQPIEILDNVFLEGTSEVVDGQGPFSGRQTSLSTVLNCESAHEDDTCNEDFQLTEETTSIRMNKISISDTTDILKHFPASTSVVDFETPVLEVKFLSLEDSSVKFPLEALLTDMDEIAVGDGFVIAQEYNLEQNHLLVELDGNNVEEVAVNMVAGEGLEDHLTTVNQEIFGSLI